MVGLIGRLIGGAVTPLIDQLAEFGAGLLRKLALFLAAALCLIVTVIAATIAFGLWIASLAGPVFGALAVALLYLVVGVACAGLAMAPRTVTTRDEVEEDAREGARADEDRPRAEQIDRFIAPLLQVLSSLGLRREQFAVLAGASVAKQLRPLPLVGLAILAGFLIGRMYKGWRAFLSFDALAAILSTGLFGDIGATEPATENADQRS